MPAAARRVREVTAPVPPPEDNVHRAICRQVKLVMSSLLRRVDQHMQPLELTGMQWEPVLMLWLKRADTVAGLARVSQMGFASMSRMLDRLEQKQLLVRQRSDSDRRVVNLTLTDKGRDAAAAIPPVVRDELSRHLQDFSPEETGQLVSMLNRMLENGARP